MRIRYLKNTPEILSESGMVVDSPDAYKGKWLDYFAQRSGRNIEALCLEIGCGMGGFIKKAAQREPAAGWVGAERLSTILARAVRRLGEDQEELSNLALIRWEALELGEVFEIGELDRIYLNFSDPWPKERHAKRRLTSDRFLPLYDSLLKAGGVLQMKTDNDSLFEYSLEQLQSAGWTVTEETRDLYRSAFAKTNISTEYEEHFVSLGKKICCLQAVCPNKSRRN